MLIITNNQFYFVDGKKKLMLVNFSWIFLFYNLVVFLEEIHFMNFVAENKNPAQFGTENTSQNYKPVNEAFCFIG